MLSPSIPQDIPARPEARDPWHESIPARDRPDPRVWRRYIARNFDFYSIGLIPYILFSSILGFATGGLLTDFLSNEIIVILGMRAATVPVSAALISRYGYTPGKWALGLSVRKVDGQLLTWDEALKREFEVYVWGSALSFPLVSFFFMARSYRYAKANHINQWDRKLGSRIHADELSTSIVLRAVAFSILGGLAVYLTRTA